MTTTDTGMTAVGTIIEMIGAETNGAERIGVESKPVGKLNAVVIGSATRTGPCGTVTRRITATIVARATAPNNLRAIRPSAIAQNWPMVVAFSSSPAFG